MIARNNLIDILFVIVPHSLLLDIAGPAEAFRLANQHRAARGLAPRFSLRFAGAVAAPPSSVGLPIGSLIPLPAQLDATTWVVVVGQPTEHLSRVTPALAATSRWLNQQLREPLRDPESPHRLVTICSGTLLAA
ncbi:MAG: AraC family transcriptional regulator, partial [Gemmatimonadota bacterium]